MLTFINTPSSVLRTRTRRLVAARSAAVLLLLASSLSAWAAPFGYTAWDVAGSDKLVLMNLATGAGTVIGSGIGFTDIDGMSFDGSGALWGVDDSTNQLIRINTSTGAGTAVGSFGGGFNDMGLAFGGGTMFMASTDGASVGKLYTVNTGTGAATLVGSFGAGLKVRSLGYYQGTLYGWSNVDTVVTINTSTGAASTVGAFGFSSATVGQDGFDVDPATGMGWSIAEVENRTYHLNLATGHATLAASSLTCNGGSCAAGGFNSLALAPVPEPASAALWAMGLLAVGLRLKRQARLT